VHAAISVSKFGAEAILLAARRAAWSCSEAKFATNLTTIGSLEAALAFASAVGETLSIIAASVGTATRFAVGAFLPTVLLVTRALARRGSLALPMTVALGTSKRPRTNFDFA